MPLTPEEQQELSQLHQKYGQVQSSPAPAASGGLTPEEKAEFAQLHAKYGQGTQPSPQPVKGLMAQIHDMTPEQETKLVNEAAKRPITGEDDPAYQLMGLVTPGSSGLPSKLSSMFRGVGDTLMQKAMGATKVIPGLGEDFAKAGMWGTKAGMTGQATQGMEKAGQTIGDLASKIPGTIPQDAVANKVAEIAYSPNSRTALSTASGYVRPEEQAMADKVINKAVDFAKGEPLTGEEMAARRAQAGRAARQARGYAQTPASTLKAQQAVAEQAGYSEALKDAYGKAFPGATNALADADKQYSTYAKANDLLSKPESMGSASNFLSQFFPTTLTESTLGRGAIGTGKVIQRAPEGAIPLTLKKLLTPRDDK